MTTIEELVRQIPRRRSFRSFRQEPLSGELTEALIDFISDLMPPEPDIDWNFDTLPYLDMVKLCSSEPGVKAPLYLVLRAERKRFSLQDCGYLGEMAVLFLTSLNVATCWQGSVTIPQGGDFEGSLPFVTAVAVGMSDEPFRKSAGEAERKPYEKIVYSQDETYRPILELGRLAPSSFNRQPCVFVTDDRKRIHLFRKQGLIANPITEFAQCVDAGVSLAHLELGAKAQGFETEILRLYPAPKFKLGLTYQATVALK